MCISYKCLLLISVLNFVHIVESIWYLESPKGITVAFYIPNKFTLIETIVAKPKPIEIPNVIKKSNDMSSPDKNDQVDYVINKTLFGGTTARADSTYKAIGTSGFRKYDAANALTRGGGYWCSERNVLDDRVVTWTGTLKVPRSLRGIVITWEYLPAFVSIYVSRNDTGPFEEIIPFRSCANVHDIQELTFPHKVDAKVIQIRMKGQINGYFGISFVQFIGEENPLFRIQSGITSIEDMCLQVDDTGEVVLDSCVSAIANLQFSDVWRYNNKKQLYNPVTNLCMTLEDNTETNGGNIVMLPCKDDKDGRNSWAFLSNNQIKLRRPGNLCLSQTGTSAGLANVALNKIATSNYSILEDVNHTSEKALDGNAKSYWLSRKFTLDEIPEVDYIINLQEEYKIRKIDINWEIPALSYKISVKRNIQDEWTLIKDISANTLKNTSDYLQNKMIQFIKIDLIAPNPEYLDKKGKIQYGINNIGVYTNKLKTIVEPCDDVKQTKDARDKYFLESVYEVNLQSTIPLKNSQAHIENTITKLETKLANIERLTPKMSECKNKHFSFHNKTEDLKRKYDKAIERLHKLEGNVSSMRNEVIRVYPTDCINIKNLGENNQSGFYDIQPPCSKRPIRAYCDMLTGSSYYITTIEDKTVISLNDLVDVCSECGLEPLHIQHDKQIEALQIALNCMEIAAGNIFPIGVKVGNAIKSLDLTMDITKFIKTPTNNGNVVGISTNGITHIDGTNVEMAGIICSSNFNSIRLPESVMKIGCGTHILENGDFKVLPGLKYKVKCPDDCLEIINEPYQVEGGSGGIYSLSSSICVSAIHSGEYDRISPLEVEIVTATHELDGFYQNGIDSGSASINIGDPSFKVKRLNNNCNKMKADVLKELYKRTSNQSTGDDASPTGGSPLYLNPAGDISQIPATDVSNTTPANISEMTSPQLKVDVPNEAPDQSDMRIDPVRSTLVDKSEVKPTRYGRPVIVEDKRRMDAYTGDAVESLIKQMYVQNTKGSPKFLELFREHSGVVLSTAIDLIKKADLQRLPSTTLFNQLDNKVAMLQDKIQLIASHLSYKKQILLDNIEKLSREKAVNMSHDSWGMDDMADSSVYDTFSVENTNGTLGYANWVMEELKVGGSVEMTISQTSEVIPGDDVLGGSYLYLKNHKFYDFVYSCCIYAGSSGTIGVPFRVLDLNNYYLLQLKQSNGGYKRLIRVTNGTPYEIARIDDGGYIQGVWYTVRIETRQSRIMIAILQGDDPVFDVPKPVIDIIDSTHTTGTIGIYTGKISYAHFKRLHVDTLTCLRYDKPHTPPEPTYCSIYKEMYSTNFLNNWAVYNQRGVWKYERDLMGEARVIAHIWKRGVEEEREPAMVVLKNHISCSYGVFTVSVLPQCDYGSIGVVIRFHNVGEYIIIEISEGYSRLRQMYKNEFVTLSETKMRGIKMGSWNHIVVSFADDSFSVSMGTDINDPGLLFLNVKGKYDIKEGGSVGLANFNCNGCAFSNISLKPIYNRTNSSGQVLEKDGKRGELDLNGPKEENNEKYCQAIDRKSDCKKMSFDNIDDCVANYCDFCCQYHYNDKDTQSICQEQCQVNKNSVVALQKAVDQLWYKCSNNQFTQLFTNFNKNQVCNLCCKSMKPLNTLDAKLNNIAKEKCQELCTFI